MPHSLLVGYTSPTQQARVVTEGWAQRELFCPACLFSSLEPTAVNSQAVDYVCSQCQVPFQLKSSKTRISDKIPDGAYQAMISAIREDRTPDLLLLSYSRLNWQVTDLFVVPRFAFSEQAIIPRKPLAITARRAGWIGCIINLAQVVPEARIPIVRSGEVIPREEVLRCYSKLKPLQQVPSKERGWTLALLNALQLAGWNEFTTRDAYSLETGLQMLFPSNRHVRPKIRQQLQVLRDLGLLVHTGRGRWSADKFEIQ